MSQVAFAIAAHPDDIEFLMAGTLVLLRQKGWSIHCLNLSRGNLGSLTLPAHRIAQVRKAEARAAARILDAHWHPPLSRDLEILYELKLLRRLAALIRDVNPSVLLTHAPLDYMEDHMNTARLAVSAAFARGMPNFHTVPPRPHVDREITVYHAMPHMLRDPLGQPVIPEYVVDITSVLSLKRQALAAHRSQKEWLDASQGMDSYLKTMENLSRATGRLSQKFRFGEGWRRHLHAGFCAPNTDPLPATLGTRCYRHPRYKLKP